MRSPTRDERVRDCALASLLAASLLVAAASAHAFGEVVTARQADDGQVHVTLVGLILDCDSSLGGFTGGPSGSVVGNNVLITSEAYGGSCSPMPPFLPPRPYYFSQSFGVLPAGIYDVTWRIQGSIPVPIIVTTSINVLAAPLVAPVPLPLSASSGWIIGGVLVLGVWALQRRQGLIAARVSLWSRAV